MNYLRFYRLSFKYLYSGALIIKKSTTMDYSDEDDHPKMQEQIEPFQTILAPSRKSQQGRGKLPIYKNSQTINRQCTKLMNQILANKIQQTVKRIFGTIIENWTPQKSIIIAVNFKRNQKNDLQLFLDTVRSYQFKITETLKSLPVVDIPKQDVRDIALEIQIHADQEKIKMMEFDENHQKIQSKESKTSKVDSKIDEQEKGKEKENIKNTLIVYLGRRITNLSQQNIHVFERGVIDANFAVIVPTFENLKLVDGQGIVEQNEKYFFEAYNSKELFIQFFYRCIVSKTIMAYLPKQILEIIKLYDFYPISYQQGCNMLIYACQVYDAKCEQKNKPKKKLVEMKELIRTFNKCWKFVWQNEEQAARYNFEKLSRLILDEKQVYRVSQIKIQNHIKLKEVEGYIHYNENNTYETFQNKFRTKLSENKDLEHLIKYLDQFESGKQKKEAFKMKKKNTKHRQVGLGLTQTSFKSQKQHFEDKITYLFCKATEQVRRQAQYVDWKQLNVFEAMCPEIIKDTVDGILQDQDFRDVFNLIRSYANAPMPRLIDSFKRIQIGKLVYILRCLELKGLIELSKNTLKPALITNFFEKSQFKMSDH